MVARSVWWRSTAPRRPPASTSNRRSRRRASSAGVIAWTLAAASSIASGTPSRRLHTWATAAALSGVTANSAFTARARSMNRRTAAASATASWLASALGDANEGTASIRSPSIPSPSRLVASTTRRGQARSSVSTSSAAGSSTCSQLSMTTSSCLLRRNSTSASTRVCPPRRTTSNTAAMAAGTAAGSRTGASSTSHAPSEKRGSTSAAACSARRVLPTPPTPVRVTTLPSASAAPTRARSRSRPTNELSCSGRFPGKASSDRSAGNRPSPTWNTRSGRSRSRRRCSPRSTKAVGCASRTSSAVTSEHTTCPPCATAISRAQRFTAVPT